MRSRFLLLPLAFGLAATPFVRTHQLDRPLAAAAVPDDDKAIVHVLNRIGFGARPGDIEAVRAMGLQNYIERQLRPNEFLTPTWQAAWSDCQRSA